MQKTCRVFVLCVIAIFGAVLPAFLVANGSQIFAATASNSAAAAGSATGATSSAVSVASSSSVPTQSAPSATSAPSVAQQIDDAKTQYGDNLARYRNDEKNFIVAKQQFQQLQTLSALDAGVRATRQVMLSRVDVYKSYLKLLKLNVSVTRGIDVPRKDAQVAKIDQLVNDLTTHQTHVNVASDRKQIANMVTEFSTLYPRIMDTSFETLTLISYGRIRAVYDKTYALKTEIQDHLESTQTDSLQLASNERGLTETQNNLDSGASDLQKVFDQTKQLARNNNQDTYTQTTNQLSRPYATLARSLSFLQEILGQ